MTSSTPARARVGRRAAERAERKPRAPRKPKLHPAEEYLAGVRDGKIVASKYVRQAVQRHFQDLEHGPERGLKFDRDAAQHCIDFFPAFLTHQEGRLAGQPFHLTPAQQAKTWILYGWKRWSDELGRYIRRFRIAYDEEARGTGKSMYVSGLCLYELVAYGEQGAWVYSAATDKKTARLVWDTAAQMVSKNDELRELIEMRPGIANMHILDSAAKFEAVASESDNLLGLRPQFVSLDELHVHSNASVWEVFESALGKRDEPLMMAITNSGFDRHSVCWQKRSYAIKVLDAEVSGDHSFRNDTWFVWICGIDDEDDWEDESCWIKAAPDLGTLVKLSEMRQQAAVAKADPSALNAFLRFRLSRWTESHTAWMPMHLWDKCGFEVHEDDLLGRLAIGALDLASIGDIAAYLLCFPPTREDPLYRLLPRFFLPKDAIADRVKRDRVPYDRWEKEGLFTLTEGRVTDYEAIRLKVREDADKFDLKEICFDSWNSSETVAKLEQDGFTMIKWGQGLGSMNTPTKRLMELVLSQAVAHGANPVLRWMAGNVMVFTDPAGNIKPDKARSKEKIDGIVASIMALGRAVQIGEQQEVQSYVMSL